jgi:hypothetical protein
MALEKDITEQTVEWAKQHDWFKSWYVTEDGHLAIWAKEGDKVHPWPFVNRQELRNWAGY